MTTSTQDKGLLTYLCEASKICEEEANRLHHKFCFDSELRVIQPSPQVKRMIDNLKYQSGIIDSLIYEYLHSGDMMNNEMGEKVCNLRQTMAFLNSDDDVVIEVDGNLYKVLRSYSNSSDGTRRLHIQAHKLPFDKR